MSVKVKICGVTRAQDACAALDAGASAVGLNFAPESPRYLTLERAAEIVGTCETRGHANVLWAGIFINADMNTILSHASSLKLKIIQLHGDETQDLARALKQKLPLGTQIWKAFCISSADDLQQLWTDGCDAWLLDAKAPGVRGGSGQTFDWKMLSTWKRSKPLVLAGGLHPGNVRNAIETVRPDWVDVASGVESAPGIKDAELIKRFVEASLCR